MAASILSFAALFTAVFLLLMGIGLLGTLLSLRMALEGFSTQIAGWVLAAYFMGVITGSFVCQRLIIRVGHIRAFAAFAAIATASVMSHGLYISPAVWCMLRFATGIATIGLYMVIESWLNECATPDTRGRVFSVYMVCTYLGMGIGQFLLSLSDPRSTETFLLVGILLALCLVPVTVTESVHPELPTASSFPLASVLRDAPLGVMGCFTSGLVNSSFYAMGPVFCKQVGMDVHQVGGFMAATIFGGLLFQWPVGNLSDRLDRSIMLPALSAAVALGALLIFLAGEMPYPLLLLTMAVLGGCIFTTYPVAVSRTHDMIKSGDMVSVSSVLLLSYGIGASIGPIAAATTMVALATPFGLFIFCAAVSGLFAFTAIYLRTREKITVIPVAEQVEFVAMKNTSAVATALDPRTPPDSEGGSGEM